MRPALPPDEGPRLGLFSFDNADVRGWLVGGLNRGGVVGICNRYSSAGRILPDIVLGDNKQGSIMGLRNM